MRAARFLVAIVGGYIAMSWTAAWVALVLIEGLGMQRGDAVILTALLSIVGYAGIVTWAFGHPSATRTLWLLLAWSLASVAMTHVLASAEPSHVSRDAR